MSNQPQIFHGEWWVPAIADRDVLGTVFEPHKILGYEKKYTGTLTYYEDDDSILELYHVPSDYHWKHYKENKVMWGKDLNGHIFTLFNVLMKGQVISDFTKAKFVVGLILIGKHVLSIDDAIYNKCVVHFPYLRNWAFHDNITSSNAGSKVYYKTPIFATNLLKTVIEDGSLWRLWQGQNINRSIYDLTIIQKTTLEIEAIKPYSIQLFLRQIEEFSQFLSIALYCDQNPSKIEFTNERNETEGVLLFKKEASVDPQVFSLIKFGILKEKLPSMLKTWHLNFESIAPISSYLINSLKKKNRFDVPDFLIIAEALDGYYKRFMNKKNGKDIRKYEKQIELLLNQFKEVKAIKECNINPEILKDTRHKYSHLYPDEEKSLAVKGEDLYWLTEKCKILLTCCILNMLGLTNKEINLCCDQSPISQILYSLPSEED